MNILSKQDLAPQFQPLQFVQDYSVQTKLEGVQLIDLKHFSDDGGFFMELARLGRGVFEAFPDFEVKQINYSEVHPGVIKAAHLHFFQEDIWIVPPTSKLLIGLLDARQDSPTSGKTMRFIMGDGRARALYIPRGVAHGYANHTPKDAAIIYFVNNQFNPDPEKTDEKRLPWDAYGKEFWDVARG